MSEYLTTVEKTEREFGPNSIFLVKEDYHGKYEDDYCYFTYFNNVTGEILSDYWTTAGACPSYGRYECKRLDDAKKEGLLDMEKWNAYKIGCMRYVVEKFPFKIEAKHHPVVEVKRGRKWKGIGVLISVKKSSYSWGPSYGRGYNTSVSETAVIYSLEERCLRECNYTFVEIHEPEKLKASYQAWANDIIDMAEKVTGRDAERMDREYDWSFERYMRERYEALGIDADNASHPEQEERERKEAEKREKILAGIREWVLEKTDKREPEEVEALVMGIYRKRYC